MPSTPYDLVKDDQDLRVPMHAEKAFFHGITFQAKFIGWEEVPRPNTRAEIVQAMRRIRYECKVQNLKKRKVTINVSVDGVRVLLKKRRRKKKQWTNDPEEIELMNHPVYRIFYVSHDSSDLKIFSYIARDASTDTFKCSVFKSNKKSQAMRVVRTVGQAFEVCHKFNLHKNSLDNNDERSDLSSELFDAERIQEQLSDEEILKKDQIAVTPEINTPQRPNHLELVPQANNCNIRKSPCSDGEKSPSSPLSSSQEVYKLKEQLEQQASQTRQALSQLMLVREQLISETNARMEAQARTQQLLQQNRELLEHLASLGAYNEQAQPGLTSANIALAPQSPLQMLLQDQSDMNGTLRKAFLTTPCNNNLASINQQLNNLGSINQQLTSLSHQLSGLNQQSQNLQNYQNVIQQPQVTQQSQSQSQSLPLPLTQPQPHPSPKPQHHQMQIQQSANINNNNNNNNNSNNSNNNQYPTLNQLQSISNQLTGISNQNNQDILSKELFQMNQELLNRLQNLNLGINGGNNNNNNISNINNNNNNSNNNHNNNGNSLTAQNLSSNNTSSSNNSYFYVNPMSCSPNPTHNNSNFNFLSSPSSLGNLTPSPMGTLNRNSYSNSPINDDLGLSIDKNLNSLEDGSFIRPLSSLNHNSHHHHHNNNGGGIASGSLAESNRSDSSSSPHKLSDQRLNIPNNTVMLKVTDESGNITNTKKLSATPSFITRSTSEKVPNRSQIMSQVQRTAWARHTTK